MHYVKSTSGEKMIGFQIVLLIWGILQANTVKADDSCINQDAVRSAEYRLKSDLLCNYNTGTRPVKDHSKTLQVGMSLRVLRIIPGMESYGDDTVTVNCIVLIFWYDEYLKWSPTDYGNILRVSISANKIWVPQVILMNSALEPPTTPYELNTECQLDRNGHVLCMPKASFSAICKGDHLKWPFDRQVCSLHFRALAYVGESLNFTHSGGVPSDEMRKVLGEKNRHWELLSANISTEISGSPINNVTFPQVIYRIEMRRQSATKAAMAITPAIGMILLTLTSLFLNVASEERMILLSVNLICHYVCMQQLIWMVPYNGNKCPLIVLFYRNSLIVTTFVLLASLILKNMLSNKTNRFDTLISIFNKPPIKYVMFRTADSLKSSKLPNENDINKDDSSTEETKANNVVDSKWVMIVLFFDRIQFIAVILVYLGLCISLLTV